MTEQITALVVTPDGTAHTEHIDAGFQSIKALLDDGWLEAVSGVRGEWIAYADEEGRLKHLQPNGLAAGIIMASGGNPVAPVGNVVFVGERWVGGEDGYAESDVPKEMLELVFPLGNEGPLTRP